MREIYTIEAEYLHAHPDSGYLTEILPLKSFPDYIDYLPHGCIVRKIGVMAYRPERDQTVNYLSLSPDEYRKFVEGTIQLVIRQFAGRHLLPQEKSR